MVTNEDLYRATPRAMTTEHLRAWMVWHQMSQIDLATATRVDRRTVYRWLNNKNKHSIPRGIWPSLASQFGDPLPPFTE